MVRPRDVCVSAQSELGIPTVGIYSKEDHLCPHRYKADESYLVCACMRVSPALAVHSTLACKLAHRSTGGGQLSTVLDWILRTHKHPKLVCLAAPPPPPSLHRLARSPPQWVRTSISRTSFAWPRRRAWRLSTLGMCGTCGCALAYSRWWCCHVSLNSTSAEALLKGPNSSTDARLPRPVCMCMC